MNKSLQVGVAVAAGLALVVAFLGFYRPLVVNVQVDSPELGATTNHTEEEQFLAEIRLPAVETGIVTTLHINDTLITLSSTQICDSNVIAWAPGATASATLPTEDLLGANCMPNNGDRIELLINNDSASGTNYFTVLAGSGITMLGENNTSTVAIAQARVMTSTSATLTLVRVTASEVVAWMSSLVDTD